MAMCCADGELRIVLLADSKRCPHIVFAATRGNHRVDWEAYCILLHRGEGKRLIFTNQDAFAPPGLPARSLKQMIG